MENSTPKIGAGLRPLPKDGRDFKLTKLLGAINLSELPEEFLVDGWNKIKIKDQGNTDYCTAYAGTSASELQEGVELNPLFQFIKTKQIMGDPESWGADLRSLCKSLAKFGSLEESETPATDFGRDWQDWPIELDEKAQKHLKKSYFEADGYDGAFNAIKAALWQNKVKKRAVIVGTVWRSEWTSAIDGIIPEEYGEQGFGHAFIIVGWDKRGLIAHLSNGEIIGDKGRFYFSKKITDKELGKYGEFLLVDIDPEGVKKIVWSPWQRFIEWFKKLFK